MKRKKMSGIESKQVMYYHDLISIQFVLKYEDTSVLHGLLLISVIFLRDLVTDLNMR